DGCPASCRFYTSSGVVSSAFAPLANPTRLVVAGGQDPNDDGQAVLQLPFAFEYFDVPATMLTISVNGIISTGAIPINASYQNRSIPNPDPPNNLIAAWWEDLYLDPQIGGALLG